MIRLTKSQKKVLAKAWCELNSWQIPKKLPSLSKLEIAGAMKLIETMVSHEILLKEWNK